MFIFIFKAFWVILGYSYGTVKSYGIQNLPDEEKNKKPQYARKRYRNLSEEEKEKKCQYGCELIKLF